MSSDVAGLNLKEPDQMDWDNFNPGGKYQPPPDALDASGKAIIYNAQLPTTLGSKETLDATQDGYRSFRVGPLTLVKNGNGADGYQIRFYTVSVKKFNDREGNPINVSSAGKLIRAAGVNAKPQRNAEYEAAIKACAGRIVPIVIDWEARNKDTGEEVKGFENFPIDPATGRRKAILKAGDKLSNGEVVKSEVLFANARVRYVMDPRR